MDTHLRCADHAVLDPTLPNVRKVADPFHVQMLATTGLDACRRRVQNCGPKIQK